MKMYINGTGCVAPQDTRNKPLFEELQDEAVLQTKVLKPNYRDYIPPVQIRRMGNAIKMGVVASKDALAEAQVESPDAIIVGTGLGCQQDSEKFLEAILSNDEQFLTPTSFIQSTHNTVAGQVALMLKCNAYNFTYCHRGFSFENALVDAEVTFAEGAAQNILVMGIDEITEHTRQVFQRINWNVQDPIQPSKLFKNTGEGTIYGEGANAFVLSSEQSEQTLACISSVEMIYKPGKEDVVSKLESLRNENSIDLVLVGYNGDEKFDQFYPEMDQLFPNAAIGAFKHLVGEYHTASSFAMWLASQIIQDQVVPNQVIQNGNQPASIESILIYNHYNNLDHSFILVEK